MTGETEHKTFWDSLTGSIVKITALLAAITGLIVAINPYLKSCNQKSNSTASNVDTTQHESYTPPDKPADTPQHHIFSPPEIRDFLDAAANGKIEILKQDLDLGINPDITLNDNKTALVYALDNDESEAVKLLLARGADPNVKVRGNTFPIIEASYSGQSEIVDALIQQRAEINKKKEDGSGLTALMFACIRGHADIVQKLINVSYEQLDVNATSHDNSTALDYANELPSPL
jgi:hypothetical protein